MPTLIQGPSIIQAAGTKPKRIEEYAGRVNSAHSAVSVARMISPEGWQEPGQKPEFEEITVVLRVRLRTPPLSRAVFFPRKEHPSRECA